MVKLYIWDWRNQFVWRVREKLDGSYAVSLSHNDVTWHYSIDIRVTDECDKLRIENGPSFDNLMDVRWPCS